MKDTVSCPISTKKNPEQFILTIHCQQCNNGQSTIQHKTCRKNIISLLQQYPETTQLILQTTYIKIYQKRSLSYLKELATFQEEIRTIHKLKQKSNKKTRNHNSENPYSDIFKQFQHITNHPELFSKSTLQRIKTKTPLLHLLSNSVSPSTFYHDYLRPYIRPKFIDSFIQMKPPPDAIFETQYTINSNPEKQATVILYSQKNSPENLYFLLPSEYQLSQQDIHLLETVRKKLSKHQPNSSAFIEHQNTKNYFKRFAKQTIIETLHKNKKTKQTNTQHINKLADIFAQYTAGLGIIENVLNDSHIQDIYVNAPVQHNPLHIVVNGEEYSSNIFLSNHDVDALSSRFRTLSGRPFSEANPILDMDLPQFHTRIAAIGQPLTPKGTAFAFRRHRKKPWTLAHFIANNMLSAEAAGLLSFLVDGQASLLIAGSRGAGKTSLLTALLLEIPLRYRILTIEDTSEIPISHFQSLGYKAQSLLTKSISSSEGSTEIHPTDALRTALRLGESVLIIGEVRGVEAKVLFEAMRVGAAGNLIMGTIHGSTPTDVFERIVYDIGVPPTSFKAVDAIVVAAPIRKQGGVNRIRRVTAISETVKTAWNPNITGKDVFQSLMSYDTKEDTLNMLPRVYIGQSSIIQQIAKQWGISVEKALENIRVRTHIKKQIVHAGTNIDPVFLEASVTKEANNRFWMLVEHAKRTQFIDYQQIQNKWDCWFTQYIERRTF
ncbi:MAG: type II/IV secretion system ATPase subunit [Candidatus Thermoplasmatota archaeon]|nr:type II/IV secretion system ATPase subunit [Candidatus Thermoplasmatota archaeon]